MFYLLKELAINTERRQYSRVNFDVEAELITTQEHLNVQVLDLSLRGALLRLPDLCVAALGSPCLLKVLLGDKKSRISIAGEVAHVEGNQAGVLCRSIDIESITHLRRLIEMNLGDASLVERELGAMISPE